MLFYFNFGSMCLFMLWISLILYCEIFKLIFNSKDNIKQSSIKFEDTVDKIIMDVENKNDDVELLNDKTNGRNDNLMCLMKHVHQADADGQFKLALPNCNSGKKINQQELITKTSIIIIKPIGLPIICRRLNHAFFFTIIIMTREVG